MSPGLVSADLSPAKKIQSFTFLFEKKPTISPVEKSANNVLGL